MTSLVVVVAVVVISAMEMKSSDLIVTVSPLSADQQIMQVVADLFSAGMETVKTTLLWMNVFMLRHPDVMAKVKAELDSVVGRSRMPSVDDLPHLPYTESALLEGMRRASIVPLATTHATTQ